MKKKIILTESQVKKLLETRVNDFNLEDITQKLESIDCSGADLKYLVHTEGPIFTYKTRSEVSSNDRPCLTIYDVRAYQEI